MHLLIFFGEELSGILFLISSTLTMVVAAAGLYKRVVGLGENLSCRDVSASNSVKYT